MAEWMGWVLWNGVRCCGWWCFLGRGSSVRQMKVEQKEKITNRKKDFRSPVELQAERQTWNKRWKCTGLWKRKKLWRGAKARLSTLFRENFCANISLKLKNTYYILMSKMAAIVRWLLLSLLLLLLSRLMRAAPRQQGCQHCERDN